MRKSRRSNRVELCPMQKVGSLTLIKQLSERLNGQIVWECECDCGRMTRVRAGSLRSKNTTSCGKCKKLTEVVFGDFCYGTLVGEPAQHHLKAVQYTKNRSATGDRFVLCECRQCGETLSVRTNQLLTRRCPCWAPHKPGDQRAFLLLLRPERRDAESGWLCRCVRPDPQTGQPCGKEVWLRTRNLPPGGETQSCGCLKREVTFPAIVKSTVRKLRAKCRNGQILVGSGTLAFSQKEFAAKLGVTPSIVFLWKRDGCCWLGGRRLKTIRAINATGRLVKAPLASELKAIKDAMAQAGVARPIHLADGAVEDGRAIMLALTGSPKTPIAIPTEAASHAALSQAGERMPATSEKGRGRPLVEEKLPLYKACSDEYAKVEADNGYKMRTAVHLILRTFGQVALGKGGFERQRKDLKDKAKVYRRQMKKLRFSGG